MKDLLLFIGGSLITLTTAAQNPVDSFRTYQQLIPGSSISFTMVPITGGSFTMGSDATEKGHETDEAPRRQVSISPFWMASMEVSRDAFDVFYKDESISQNSDVDAITRPSPQYIDFSLGMGKEGGYPVNSMSQQSALMYCRWLYNKTGIFYRLPTEAEWEYACRAGSNERYFFGSDEKELDQYAWYTANSQNKFHKSGTKKPNAWGLYDMIGNVAEWTLDHYYPDPQEALTDKVKDPKTTFNASRYPKTLKGGGYNSEATELRSANRIKSIAAWNRRDPQIPKSPWWLTEGSFIGFRIIRPLEQPSPSAANAFFDEYLQH